MLYHMNLEIVLKNLIMKSLIETCDNRALPVSKEIDAAYHKSLLSPNCLPLRNISKYFNMDFLLPCSRTVYICN